MKSTNSANTDLALVPPGDPRRLASLTARERMHELQRCLGISVEALRQAALIYSIMEAAGDDTSALSPHTRRMLQRIGGASLLPEVVVQYHGLLRERIGLLPIPEQRQLLADTATVPYVPEPGGDPIQIAVKRLEPAQIKQVFGLGVIRTPEEQTAYLRKQASQTAAASPHRAILPGVPGVRIDVDACVAVVSAETTLSRRQIRLIAKALTPARQLAKKDDEFFRSIHEKAKTGIPLTRLARENKMNYQTFFHAYKRWLNSQKSTEPS